MSKPTPDSITSYILENEVLLFSSRAQQLYYLNSSAAFIWLCCEDGLDHAAISRELADSYGISLERAEKDLADILESWEAQGLVSDGSGSIPEEDIADKESPESILKDSIIQQIERKQCRHKHYYQLLDSVFLVRCNDEHIETVMDSVIGHLELSEPVEEADAVIDVQKDWVGYSVFLGNRLVSQCESADHLAPLIHAELLSETYNNTDFLTAIHAAAISNGKECIVLPGDSGSGKSTLTAALVSSGYQYFTDEMVFLQHQTQSVQTVTAGIAIKPGSWSVLKDYYPEIERVPVYVRQDNKQVRYLIPPVDALPDSLAMTHEVTALVFPAYRPESPTSLNSISQADALCRLTTAGYDMRGEIDSEQVAELIGWISGIACYELNIQNLPDAMTAVKEILP